MIQRMDDNRHRSQSQTIELLFYNRKIDEVSEYLEQHPEIDLISLKSSDNNTVLHQLSYEGHLDIVQLFVKEAKKRLVRLQRKKLYERDQKQEVVVWMNHQNNQGFTALLYAAYNGHLDLIKYFVEEYGVNHHLTTNTGLNVLHLAAQKNMVLPLLYFKQRIDINTKDQLNSTSLHWAAYMNCQQVTAYLLSQEGLTCLDDKDNEGHTPLALAVIYGNTRVVRRLLIRGADRYLANNEGKIPMDIAKEQQYKTITRMLDEDYTCCDLIRFYCNVKLEYKPKDRKLTIPMVFILSLVLNIAVLNLSIVFYQWYPIYAEILLMTTMFIIYLTLLKGPDQLQKRDENQLFRDKTQKILKKYCFECKNVTPKRGYHCDICHACISQYDHHCTWINNCVGKRNIGRFIFFLLFLILSLGFIGFVSCLAELSLIMDKYNQYGQWFQLRYVYTNLTERIALMAIIAINFVSALFVFPVLMLFVVQIKNLLKNKTTYEMMRSPGQEQGQIKSKMKIFRSKMSIRNCRIMCSDNPVYLTTSLSSNDMLDEVSSPGLASKR